MAPQRHRYTKCILFTGQRANKSNERVVCKYCSEAESPQWALQNALLCNTKKLVKSHLRRCRYFLAAQASGLHEPIVFTEDEGDDSGDEHKSNNSARKSNNKRQALVFVDDNPSHSSNNALLEGAGSKKNDANAVNKRFKTDIAVASQAKLPRAPAEQDALERLLLDATLANGWAFSWVDQRASARLLQYLHPYVQLPSGESLAGRVLETAGEKEAACVWGAVEKERLGATVVLDAWKQVARHGVVGVMLTTSQGEVLVWDTKSAADPAELVARSSSGGSALQKLVAAQLEALDASSVPVIALVADSSDGYAATRRELRRARRDLMVLPCAAHQLNAFLGDMFTLVPMFAVTVRKAIDLALELQRSVRLQGRLWHKLRDLGQPPVALLPLPEQLEWETLRSLTMSLLGMKDALQAVMEDQGVRDALPPGLVRAIGSDDAFWQPLVDLDSILFHVARWIAIIKLHQGRLHYVPIVKHAIAATLQHQLSPELGSPLLERLEARWDEWEHPLLVLAVVLNPAFGWKFIDSSSGVTLMRLSCWARYYFESYFGSQPHNLPNEVVEYVEGDKFWCSPASIASFSTPVYRPATPAATSEADRAAQEDAELFARLSFKVVQYWKSCSTDCPELSKLALRIFAVSVTSASTDGLFEAMPSMKKKLPSSPGERSGHLLHLAATRVRARAKYEQRHDGGTSQYTASFQPPAAGDDEADKQGPSEKDPSQDDDAEKHLASEHAKLDELLARWDEQRVQNVDDGVERESTNENEAINSMYEKIHPADDKFSKYSIQTLFQSN